MYGTFLGLTFRGDRCTPILTDYTMLSITSGGRGRPSFSGGTHTSRIWHTKEANLSFQYRQYNVRKSNVAVICRFFPGVQCNAKMTIIPRNPNLILSKQDKKGKNRYFINHEAPLNKDRVRRSSVQTWGRYAFNLEIKKGCLIKTFSGTNETFFLSLVVYFSRTNMKVPK